MVDDNLLRTVTRSGATAPDYFLYTAGARVPRNVTRVRVHHSVEHIPVNAFRDCTDLIDVELHNGLQSIGRGAFINCSSLLRIKIPSSVTTIGSLAFAACIALIEVKLNEGLQRIGRGAFNDCRSLLRIKIPLSVIAIDDGTFHDCTALAKVELHEGLQTIGSHAFAACTALIEVKLHEGLQRIGSGAFRDCRSLLRIKIPPSVIAIDDSSFRDCTVLVEVSLHEGLQRIGRGAFRGCRSLLSIKIPFSTSAIGRKAFDSCNLMRNVAIYPNYVLLQEEFRKSFTFFRDDGISLDSLKTRFNELPLHALCFDYPPIQGNTVQAEGDIFIQTVNRLSPHQFQHKDCLGMTPLHVLLCSGKNLDLNVIQCIIEKCPNAMLTQDDWGKVPLAYALMGDASMDIIHYLFDVHRKRYGSLPFNFCRMILKLAIGGKSAQFVRDIIQAQRDHFPSLEVNWHYTYWSSINQGQGRDHVRIGTFRVIVEASCSTRRYNCMIEEHRIEVDHLVRDIERDTDYLKYVYRSGDGFDDNVGVVMRYYEKICSLVRNNVHLHRGMLRGAAQTLAKALPRLDADAIESVLDFL